MAVAISCAGCSRPLRVPENQLGQLVRCPLCFDIFTAAAPPPPAAAPLPLAVAAESDEAELVLEFAPGAHHASVDEERPVPLAPLESEPETEPKRRPARREAAPAPVRRSGQRGPTGLSFGVFVTRDSERAFRGRVEAEITEDGLLLYKGGSTLRVLAAPGTARYRGGNRFAVRVEGRHLELTLIKSQTAQERLARDVVAFLNDEGDLPRASVYSQPWFLSLLPLLALGIPALAVPLEVPTPAAGFVALWVIGSFVLLSLGYVLLYGPRWTLAARLGSVVGLLGLGYVGFLVALLVSLSLSPEPLPAALWSRCQGAHFEVQMPGAPILRHQRHFDGSDSDEYSLFLPRYEMRFSVWERTAPVFGDLEDVFRQEKHRLQPPASPAPHARTVPGSPRNCREWQYDYPTATSSRGLRVVRVYVVGGRLFTLVAEGPWTGENDQDARKFMNSFRVQERFPPPRFR